MKKTLAIILSIVCLMFAVVGYSEKITDTIQERNGLTYIPNETTPFTGVYILSNWYKNGQKQAELHYKDGKQEGLVTSWYENGQKKSEGNYKDGKREGLVTSWYKNGQKEEEINWKDGKQEGLVTYF
jgi:antitoxin component YwqK of YwqJK toxin-antitoxin module